MFAQLSFYVRHSWNDMRVNSRRTAFALLCIAAGVAAIVSLQTLAAMISLTLTANLQANNRGDLQLAVLFTSSNAAEQALEEAAELGYVAPSTIAFGGQAGTAYQLSEAGYNAIATWLEAEYPGQAQITYRQSIADFLQIFTGSGVGVGIVNPADGSEARGTVPVMVDSAVYPFYSQVTTQDGQALAEVLQAPADLVLSRVVAERLGVQVGATVNVQGIASPFTVRGIVEDSAEIRNPQQDIFAALNGFYLVDVRSRPLFGELPVEPQSVYVQLDPALDVAAVDEALSQTFQFVRVTSTADLAITYALISDSVNQLVTVMGLVSLLLGSIGIVNTMQVIVRRRTLEIAVLKTIGMQGDRITQLFLTEAALMGAIGSVLGVLLGWVMVFVIRGVAERLLGTPLPFVFAPNAVVAGLLVGTVVTTVFGLLPTLTAGIIRPILVLRPTEEGIPRVGIGRTLAALLAMMFLVSLVTAVVVGNFVLAFGIVVATFIVAAFFYVLLVLLIWLVARLTPRFGSVDLRLVLGEMLVTRRRGATTLLALVVGVFSLSLVTLLADSVTQVTSSFLLRGDNLFIQLGAVNDLERVEAALNDLPGPVSYTTTRTYNLEWTGIRRANGETEVLEVLQTRLEETASFRAFIPTTPTPAPGVTPTPVLPADARDDIGERRADNIASEFGSISAYDLARPINAPLLAGRWLDASDVGQTNIILETSGAIEDLSVQVGDVLLFDYSYGGLLGIGATRGETAYTIVGIYGEPETQSFVSSEAYALGFPDGMPASQARISATVPQEQINTLRRALDAVPNTFIIETDTINRFIQTLIGQFTAFPILVALLSLVVGGVVIANSVALSTMERRREIAVMKAVGLQRERVVGMVLLESGLLGFIGGLLGVGLGLIGLVLLLGTAPGALQNAIPWGTAFLLMLLCVAIGVLAALATAWGASGEKPLNVLRYE